MNAESNAAAPQPLDLSEKGLRKGEVIALNRRLQLIEDARKTNGSSASV